MSEPEEHGRGVAGLYDVLYTSPLGEVPPMVAKDDRPLVEQAMRQPNNPHGPNGLDFYSGTMIALARPLVAVRRFVRAFHDDRTPAGLVPVRYRQARVSQQEARLLVQTLFTHWHAVHGGSFGPLSQGADRRLYWQFHAADLLVEKEGGGAWFSVDRCDGHQVTSHELHDWVRFSRGSRTTADHWHGIPDRYDLQLTARDWTHVPNLPEEDRRFLKDALSQGRARPVPEQPHGHGGTLLLSLSLKEMQRHIHTLSTVGIYRVAVSTCY